MKSPLRWFDRETGLVTTVGNWLQRPIAGGPAWRFVWPTMIAFLFLVQAITGLTMWMYYSAGAQSSWESVYYLQYHVQCGGLLRAIHFYAAQAMLVLVGIYLMQMIVRGVCRPHRKFLFWTVLLMGLATLGLNLTGDLLPWDQNSYWATSIRVAYLGHLPGVGPRLSELAVGGPQFGTLTLTRFLTLHVGICTVALLGLLLLHAHLAARYGMEVRESRSLSGKGANQLPSPSGRGAGGEGVSGERATVPYWPRQAWRDMAACCIVLGVIVALSARHGISGPRAGIELGAPANPVDDPHTARPEWSLRGLYQLHELLSGWPEQVSIFVIPGLTVLLFFAMPWIGRNATGRGLNIALTFLVLAGLGVLTLMTYWRDAKDDAYQAALKAGREQAERVKELVMKPGPEELEKAEQSGLTPPTAPRIPTGGALALLRSESKPKTPPTLSNASPKTEGPRIFNQHCASCHDYSGPASGITRPRKPTAADLYRFASREWLTEFLTVKGIASPKFFGNTKFKQKAMYGFLKDTFFGEDMKEEDRTRIIQAISHEAGLTSQRDADHRDLANIAAGNKLVKENCTDCHVFYGKSGGTGEKGPDLTGYGSREWLLCIIGNPAHKRFYGKQNDRMSAYLESTSDVKKNLLSRQELELLVDWLRGEWYEAEK